VRSPITISTTTSTAAHTILAPILGKYKILACRYDPDIGEIEYRTRSTGRESAGYAAASSCRCVRPTEARLILPRTLSDITRTRLAHARSSKSGEDASALALIPADGENGTRKSKHNVARRSAHL
jgi:hypothetical protein